MNLTAPPRADVFAVRLWIAVRYAPLSERLSAKLSGCTWRPVVALAIALDELGLRRLWRWADRYKATGRLPHDRWRRAK